MILFRFVENPFLDPEGVVSIIAGGINPREKMISFLENS
jgi:hypothetical protein